MAGLQGWIALAGGAVAVAAFVAERADRTRAQASAVYAMVTSFRYGVGQREKPPDHTTVEIRNGSDRPILDVGVSAWDWGDRRRLWRLRPHEQWMTGRRLAGRLYVTITPDTSVTDDSLPPASGPGPSADKASLRPPIMLTFRDANGRRWVRWPDGRLSRRWPSR